MVSLADLAYVVILSLLPVFEGRYALLVGIARGLVPQTSFAAASLGVGVLAYALPQLLPLVDVVARGLAGDAPRPISTLAKAYLAYLARTRRRAGRYVEKYGFPGLLAFVSIPFPATGIWTGAIAAYLLGMKRSKTTAALLLGGIASNTITLVLALAAGRAA